jgi:hypothetical protein
VSTRKGRDFHAEEDALDGGIVFHEEVEPIDPWDDILHDGRIKYRTLHDAYEEYKRINRERCDT